MVEDFLHKALLLHRNASAVGAEGGCSNYVGAARLYHLAQPGGLGGASEEELHHLSLCAVCQKEWGEWLDTAAILAGDDSVDDQRETAVGFLRAASASLFTEPVSLESSCGRFELSIYPERDHPARGMVVLEVKSLSDDIRQRYCVVRDNTGAVILQGALDDGRLAGRIEMLARLDLKTWTVVVSGG